MRVMLFCFLLAFAYAEKLQQCSYYENVTLVERKLCINSTIYPVYPMVVLPYIYVIEVLDFNHHKSSITFSLHMMLKWNDTGVIATGPNKQQK